MMMYRRLVVLLLPLGLGLVAASAGSADQTGLSLGRGKVPRRELSATVADLPLCSFSRVQSGAKWVDEGGDVLVEEHVSSSRRRRRRRGEVETREHKKKHSPSTYRWKHIGCDPQSYGAPEARQLLDRLSGRKVLFLGDSTMGHLHRAFASMGALKCSRPYREQSDRCSLARYLRLPYPHAYAHGQKTLGEGPFKIGLDRPGCTDCSGCSSMVMNCAAGSEVEFITMEHNMDKTVSSDRFKTTQDTIIDHYLATSPRKPDIIVVNTGLHPMAMCHFERFEEFFPGKFKSCWRRRTATFAAQAKGLLKRLQAVAPTVIWVSISAVNDGLQAPQRLSFSSNQNTIEFNKAMEPILKELSLPVLDTYRMSSMDYAMQELHSDPVHLRNHEDLYYRELAQMLGHAIMQTIQKAERKNRSEQQSATSLLKLVPEQIAHDSPMLNPFSYWNASSHK